MIFRQHTDIRAYSQYFLFRNNIAMESPAIKQYKISSLRVDFYRLIEWLILFVFLRHQVPIRFKIEHLLFFEVFVVIVIGLWYNYKSALVLSCISESEHTLIAPHFAFCGRLITMQEGVDWDFLIVAISIHKTKTIERTLKIICFPQLLK